MDEKTHKETVLWDVCEGKEWFDRLMNLQQEEKHRIAGKRSNHTEKDEVDLALNASESEESLTSTSDPLNHATFKLFEAMQEGSIVDLSRRPYHWKPSFLPFTVCDVGAAPGGWTVCVPKQEVQLTSNSGTWRGNRQLDPKLDSCKSKITHLQMKAQQAALVIDENAKSSNTSNAGDGESLTNISWSPFGVLMCDSNNDARDTVRNLVLPIANFLAPGGLLILTVKLPKRFPLPELRARASPTGVAVTRVEECKSML
ncbi:hypothetical protein GUITHDRAFT_132016 [Guillardia theta CCMP2712]|uniref:Ribosomal RNA methyltransferase FtsJ domain-containing protein n=1 Tax=Guillardia theta (strain CCMP2712) TaxID=905079 RepID=L1K3B7_GUITC|nr:hypothetical protein GUITHDRAFT_132016 [Guillardia theta CCMP2712]EKX55087.1 hypothetical protein GUITHDRAFT_132016 [Guillardia theta CCMP2712]|eukprot:XP_005842067.1 hypothetical protein GUITHDRAFT_132016 [Guillardia theta CCMP2712]